MDKRVEIHGTSRADINGKRGVATDFHWYEWFYEDESKSRYTVQLDSGEAFKLKPASVRAGGTGGGVNTNANTNTSPPREGQEVAGWAQVMRRKARGFCACARSART